MASYINNVFLEVAVGALLVVRHDEFVSLTLEPRAEAKLEKMRTAILEN
jgi:hypothetical protein